VRSIYKGGVVRDTTMLMGAHYLKRDRFEGSQAMPASPSGGGCAPKFLFPDTAFARTA
jgi:hypothetical protein